MTAGDPGSGPDYSDVAAELAAIDAEERGDFHRSPTLDEDDIELPPPPSEAGPRPDLLDGITDPNIGRPDWLARDLVERGEYVLFAAGFKTGKTLVAYRIVLEALFGLPILGRHRVHALRVLIVQAEMPVRHTLRRLRRLAIGCGIDPADVLEAGREGRLAIYSRPGIDLGTLRGCTWLHSITRAGSFELVVLDSIVALFPTVQHSDNGAARQACALAFDPLTTDGVTVLALHHKRKPTAGAKDAPRDAILGAQAWSASASRIWTLDRLDSAPEDRAEGRQNAFRVKIEGQGAWGPGGDLGALMRISDDAADQATDVARLDADPKRPEAGGSKQSGAALWLSAYVRRHGRVTWKGAQAMACATIEDGGGGFATKTVERARDQAVELGWIEKVVPGEAGGRAVDLVPGEASPDGFADG